LFDRKNVAAELVFQDSMQTCKIFLTDKKRAATPPGGSTDGR
jgi:hypothetical protein